MTQINNGVGTLTLYPENQAHGDREHARLGGSSASRWMNCPGSIAMMADMPPSAPGQAALAGTEAHEYAEKALKAFLNYKVTGERLCKEDYSDIVPDEKHDEMLPMIKEYVEAVYSEVLLNDITSKAWGLEDNFCIDRNLEMCGFVDFWAIYIDKKGKRVAVILDFKYGYHYVSAHKNSQLAFYACALRSWLNDNGKDIDYVRCAIYQPRNRGFENKAYRETKYTAKQLDSWKGKFTKAAQQIFNSSRKAKTKAGDHCMFCPAKAICTKYLQHTGQRTNVDLLRDDVAQTLPAVDKLTDEQITRLITHGDLITDYISAAKKYVVDKHNAGKPVQGLKVVQGPTRRTWVDDDKSIVKFLLDQGLDPQDICQMKVKGITAIEKKLSPDLKVELQKFITQTKPSLAVVPDTEANSRRIEAVSTVALLGD